MARIVRRVRTPAGAAYYGQPIGTIITRDMIAAARARSKSRGLQPPRGALSTRIMSNEGAARVAKRQSTPAEKIAAAKKSLEGRPQAKLRGSNTFALNDQFSHKVPDGTRSYRSEHFPDRLAYLRAPDGKTYRVLDELLQEIDGAEAEKVSQAFVPQMRRDRASGARFAKEDSLRAESDVYDPSTDKRRAIQAAQMQPGDVLTDDARSIVVTKQEDGSWVDENGFKRDQAKIQQMIDDGSLGDDGDEIPDVDEATPLNDLLPDDLDTEDVDEFLEGLEDGRVLSFDDGRRFKHETSKDGRDEWVQEDGDTRMSSEEMAQHRAILTVEPDEAVVKDREARQAEDAEREANNGVTSAEQKQIDDLDAQIAELDERARSARTETLAARLEEKVAELQARRDALTRNQTDETETPEAEKTEPEAEKPKAEPEGDVGAVRIDDIAVGESRSFEPDEPVQTPDGPTEGPITYARERESSLKVSYTVGGEEVNFDAQAYGGEFDTNLTSQRAIMDAIEIDAASKRRPDAGALDDPEDREILEEMAEADLPKEIKSREAKVKRAEGTPFKKGDRASKVQHDREVAKQQRALDRATAEKERRAAAPEAEKPEPEKDSPNPEDFPESEEDRYLNDAPLSFEEAVAFQERRWADLEAEGEEPDGSREIAEMSAMAAEYRQNGRSALAEKNAADAKAKAGDPDTKSPEKDDDAKPTAPTPNPDAPEPSKPQTSSDTPEKPRDLEDLRSNTAKYRGVSYEKYYDNSKSGSLEGGITVVLDGRRFGPFVSDREADNAASNVVNREASWRADAAVETPYKDLTSRQLSGVKNRALKEATRLRQEKADPALYNAQRDIIVEVNKERWRRDALENLAAVEANKKPTVTSPEKDDDGKPTEPDTNPDAPEPSKPQVAIDDAPEMVDSTGISIRRLPEAGSRVEREDGKQFIVDRAVPTPAGSRWDTGSGFVYAKRINADGSMGARNQRLYSGEITKVEAGRLPELEAAPNPDDTPDPKIALRELDEETLEGRFKKVATLKSLKAAERSRARGDARKATMADEIKAFDAEMQNIREVLAEKRTPQEVPEAEAPAEALDPADVKAAALERLDDARMAFHDAKTPQESAEALNRLETAAQEYKDAGGSLEDVRGSRERVAARNAPDPESDLDDDDLDAVDRHLTTVPDDAQAVAVAEADLDEIDQEIVEQTLDIIEPEPETPIDPPKPKAAKKPRAKKTAAPQVDEPEAETTPIEETYVEPTPLPESDITKADALRLLGAVENSPNLTSALKRADLQGSSIVDEARAAYPNLAPKKATIAHLRAQLGDDAPSPSDGKVKIGTMSRGATKQGVAYAEVDYEDALDAQAILNGSSSKFFKKDLEINGNPLGDMDPTQVTGGDKDKAIAKAKFQAEIDNAVTDSGIAPTPAQTTARLDALQPGSIVATRLGQVFEKDRGYWRDRAGTGKGMRSATLAERHGTSLTFPTTRSYRPDDIESSTPGSRFLVLDEEGVAGKVMRRTPDGLVHVRQPRKSSREPQQVVQPADLEGSDVRRVMPHTSDSSSIADLDAKTGDSISDASSVEAPKPVEVKKRTKKALGKEPLEPAETDDGGVTLNQKNETTDSPEVLDAQSAGTAVQADPDADVPTVKVKDADGLWETEGQPNAPKETSKEVLSKSKGKKVRIESEPLTREERGNRSIAEAADPATAEAPGSEVEPGVYSTPKGKATMEVFPDGTGRYVSSKGVESKLTRNRVKKNFDSGMSTRREEAEVPEVEEEDLVRTDAFDLSVRTHAKDLPEGNYDLAINRIDGGTFSLDDNSVSFRPYQNSQYFPNDVAAEFERHFVEGSLTDRYGNSVLPQGHTGRVLMFGRPTSMRALRKDVDAWSDSDAESPKASPFHAFKEALEVERTPGGSFLGSLPDSQRENLLAHAREHHGYNPNASLASRKEAVGRSIDDIGVSLTRGSADRVPETEAASMFERDAFKRPKAPKGLPVDDRSTPAQIDRHIDEVGKNFGDGETIGQHREDMTDDEKRQWVEAVDRGHFDEAYNLERAAAARNDEPHRSGFKHPGEPGNSETHKVDFAPANEDERRAQEVPGEHSDQDTAPAAEVDRYLRAANVRVPENVSGGERRRRAKEHQEGRDENGWENSSSSPNMPNLPDRDGGGDGLEGLEGLEGLDGLPSLPQGGGGGDEPKTPRAPGTGRGSGKDSSSTDKPEGRKKDEEDGWENSNSRPNKPNEMNGLNETDGGWPGLGLPQLPRFPGDNDDDNADGPAGSGGGRTPTRRGYEPRFDDTLNPTNLSPDEARQFVNDFPDRFPDFSDWERENPDRPASDFVNAKFRDEANREDANPTLSVSPRLRRMSRLRRGQASLVDRNGNGYNFRPNGPDAVEGDPLSSTNERAAAAARIGRFFSPTTTPRSEIRDVDVDGTPISGLVTRRPDGIVGDLRGIRPADLTPEAVEALAADNVTDWAIDNRGVRPKDFAITAAGQVLGTDKTRALQFDRSEPDLGITSDSPYARLLDDVASGRLSEPVARRAYLAAADRAQDLSSLPNTTLARLFRGDDLLDAPGDLDDVTSNPRFAALEERVQAVPSVVDDAWAEAFRGAGYGDLPELDLSAPVEGSASLPRGFNDRDLLRRASRKGGATTAVSSPDFDRPYATVEYAIDDQGRGTLSTTFDLSPEADERLQSLLRAQIDRPGIENEFADPSGDRLADVVDSMGLAVSRGDDVTPLLDDLAEVEGLLRGDVDFARPQPGTRFTDAQVTFPSGASVPRGQFDQFRAQQEANLAQIPAIRSAVDRGSKPTLNRYSPTRSFVPARYQREDGSTLLATPQGQYLFRNPAGEVSLARGDSPEVLEALSGTGPWASVLPTRAENPFASFRISQGEWPRSRRQDLDSSAASLPNEPDRLAYRVDLPEEGVAYFRTGNLMGSGRPGQPKERARARITFPDTGNSRQALQRTEQALAAMDIATGPAVDNDLELNYWREMFNILAYRDLQTDDGPKWREAREAYLEMAGGQSPEQFLAGMRALGPEEETLAWREFYTRFWPEEVGTLLENAGYLPSFSRLSLDDPEDSGSGRPYWYRLDAKEQYDAILSTGRVVGHQTTDPNPEMVESMLDRGGLGSDDDFVQTRIFDEETDWTFLLHPSVALRTRAYALPRDLMGEEVAPYTPNHAFKNFAPGLNAMYVPEMAALLEDVDLVRLTPDLRDQLIQSLRRLGITEIRGVPIESRVVTDSGLQAAIARVQAVWPEWRLPWTE